jgi:tRNA pseudouridine13 synthase
VSDIVTSFSLKFPRVNKEPVSSGVIKSKTADFYVEEIMRPELSGEGEHVWLWLEKDGQNTEYVAGQLARYAQVKKMDVGLSGLKDRWAVTRQWFSVYLGNKPEPDWALFECEGVKVLRFARHNKKLRRGEHSANLFKLVIRDIVDPNNLDALLQSVRDRGFPNYFGPQRFGFNGANLDRGALYFEGKIKASKSQRSFYLSAARSYLYNLNLARCIEEESWLDESEGGPLYGDEVPGKNELTEIERALLESYSAFKKGIHQNRLKLERRPYVVVPQEMTWKLEGDKLELTFELPTGVFATSLLAEVLELSQGLGEGNEALKGVG